MLYIIYLSDGILTSRSRQLGNQQLYCPDNLTHMRLLGPDFRDIWAQIT